MLLHGSPIFPHQGIGETDVRYLMALMINDFLFLVHILTFTAFLFVRRQIICYKHSLILSSIFKLLRGKDLQIANAFQFPDV